MRAWLCPHSCVGSCVGSWPQANPLFFDTLRVEIHQKSIKNLSKILKQLYPFNLTIKVTFIPLTIQAVWREVDEHTIRTMRDVQIILQLLTLFVTHKLYSLQLYDDVIINHHLLYTFMATPVMSAKNWYFLLCSSIRFIKIFSDFLKISWPQANPLSWESADLRLISVRSPSSLDG